MLISIFRHPLSIAVFLGLVLAGCASVPLDTPKEASYAIADTSDTREASVVAEWMQGHEGENGFYPLTEGFDAFGARLVLMSLAEVSLDIQYFLMKPDKAGAMFAAKMLESADRGVRVRFLLDDIFTTMPDEKLAVLNDHPNIEVRLFNPIARKGIYTFNYIGHFSLANRRMHNKSFTMDNQTAIVGGRNIADEYFQLETTGEFIDFDTICVGPVVKDISTEFDAYWNHKLAIPLEQIYKEDDPEKIAAVKADLAKGMAEAGDSIYGESINTAVMKQLASQEAGPYVAEARLTWDRPEKLLQPVSDDQKIVVGDLREAFRAAESEIFIFTPYLIPRKRGMELIKELRAKGIRMVIVTNSLATNNHTAVFSAYQKYRKDMLKAGVELWEARADAAKIVNEDGTTELANLTLHTKGVLIDRNLVFAGSLNLDPRSIDINTEMGLLIESPEMGELLTSNAEKKIPAMAYRLQLDENDKLTWHATLDGKEVVETKEPQTTAGRRFSAWFQRIVPDSQL